MVDWPSPELEPEPRYGCFAEEDEEEEEEEESLKLEVLLTFSGKAEECLRFSAPEPELCPLGNAGMLCRKAEGGVRGAEKKTRSQRHDCDFNKFNSGALISALKNSFFFSLFSVL